MQVEATLTLKFKGEAETLAVAEAVLRSMVYVADAVDVEGGKLTLVEREMATWAKEQITEDLTEEEEEGAASTG
jgi:hypothetical protein